MHNLVSILIVSVFIAFVTLVAFMVFLPEKLDCLGCFVWHLVPAQITRGPLLHQASRFKARVRKNPTGGVEVFLNGSVGLRLQGNPGRTPRAD
jgi:hypothetical protein